MKTIKIMSANLDFALRPAKVKEDLRKFEHNADCIVFQEAKRVDVDNLLKNPAWKVFQNIKRDDQQGSGVAWKSTKVSGGKRGYRLGVLPHGRGMLTRWIAFVDITYKDETNERITFRLASVHLPPKRFWSIYPLMLRNIRRFLKKSPHPVIMGGDWNKLVKRAPELQRLARDTNMKFVGHGIDGFLVSNKFKIEQNWLGPKTHSDHRPVGIKISYR